MPQCDACKAHIKNGVLFEGRLLCRKCLLEEAEKGNICPVCHEHIAPEHQVAIPFAMPSAADNAPAITKTATAVVCPRCHVLFFDDFQYKLIEGLKRS